MWRKWARLCILAGGMIALSAQAEQQGNNDADAAANAASPQWVTLASGERNGMYYWFANVLGGVVSQPPQALDCAAQCGVADTVLVNISSEGSLDNLERLRLGKVQTAFAQSGLAYAAHGGKAPFEDKGNDKLRAIASLYPEVLHIVVSKESGIEGIEGLAGKRIAMGSMQSGTLSGAQNLLAHYGMKNGDYEAQNLKLDVAMQRFLDGEVDVLFFFSAAGNPLVKEIAAQKGVRLLPVRGDVLKQLVRENTYYQLFVIPAATYQGQDEAVDGVAVQALWLANADVQDELVYALTKSLWESNGNVGWLKDAMPKGAWEMDNALKGIGIPLHPGAKQYYNEIGKRF